MDIINIYASGAEKNAPIGFTKWRNKLKEILSWEDYIEVLEPMEHFDYGDKYPISPNQCYNYFMWMVDKCDIILVNLDYTDSSIGTGIEVDNGFRKHKPIIGFGNQTNTWYDWTVVHCDVIFETMEEAIEYIKEHYLM